MKLQVVKLFRIALVLGAAVFASTAWALPKIANITVSTGTLSPGYSSGAAARNYTVELAAATTVTTITVTATPVVTGAGPSRSGNCLDIRPQGGNDASAVRPTAFSRPNQCVAAISKDFTVPAIGGSIVVQVGAYTTSGLSATLDAAKDLITVTRAASTDATLSEFRVTGGVTTPDFAADVRTYETVFPSSGGSLSVTLRPNEANAVITFNGAEVTAGSATSVTLPAAGASANLPIVVTAQDTTTKLTYAYTVTRRAPDDVALGTFKIVDARDQDAILTPDFAADVSAYASEVLTADKAVTVTIIPADTDAGVTTTPALSGSVTTGAEFPLFLGRNNRLEWRVTSADASATRDYVLTMSRAFYGVTALTVSGDAAFLPGQSFNEERGCLADCRDSAPYELSVGSGSSNFQMTATFNNLLVTVQKAGGAAAVALQPGIAGPSTPLAIATGANTYHLVVNEQTGDLPATYQFTAEKPAANVATLKQIRLGNAEVALAENIFTYAATLPFAAATVDITVTAADSDATVTGDGEQAAAFGVSSHEIGVTSADSSVTQNYALQLTRLPTLSEFSISGASLESAFAPGDLTYEAAAAPQNAEVRFTATFPAGASMRAGLRGASTVDLTSAAASAPIAIAAGENIVELTYAESGASAVYVFVVTRADAVPPPAPQNLAVTARADARLTLTWDAPAHDGGAAVSGYKVRWKYADVDSYFAPVDADSTTTHAIAELQNLAEYDVQVAAENAAGIGAYAAAVQAAPTPRPGAPQNLALTPRGGRMKVAWESPGEDGISAISGYILRWKLTSAAEFAGADTQTAAAGAREAVIENLTAAEHTVQIAAQNAAGIGDYAAGENATVPAASVPGAPQNPALTASAGTLRAVWEAPASDGNRDISGYNLRWKLSSAGAFDAADVATTAAGILSYRITHLTAAAHDVEIAARNAEGVGAYSTAVQATPDAAVAPGMPVFRGANHTVLPGNGSLTISWGAPESDGGAAVSNYLVRSKISTAADSAYTTPASVTAPTTTHVLTALTDGTSYDLQIAAQNSAGAGAYRTIAGVTPGATAAASAPRDVQVTAGEESLHAAWTRPASSRGALPGYRVQWKRASQNESEYASAQTPPGCSGAQCTAFTIAQLTAAETYDVRVQAVQTGASGELAGAFSAPVQAAPTAATAPPGAPRNVRLAQADRALRAEWDAPPLRAVSNYDARWKIAGANFAAADIAEIAADARAYEIANLQPGKTYEVQLRASGAQGDGAWSNSVSLAVVDQDVPGAPTLDFETPAQNGLTPVRPVQNTGILIYLRAPAVTGNAELLGYELRYKESDEAEYGAAVTFAAAAATSYTVTPLDADKLYDLQIAARNRIGLGAQLSVEKVSASTGVEASPPRNVTLFPLAQSLLVTADRPAQLHPTSGRLPSGYFVRWKVATADDSTYQQATVNSGLNEVAIRHTIPGLTNATAYAVQVKATAGNNQNGEWSAAVQAAPAPAAAPGAPQNLTLTAGEENLQVAWRAPATSGAYDIENYALRWKLASVNDFPAGNARTVGAEVFTANIGALRNGESYDVEVAAVSIAGAGNYASAAAAPRDLPAPGAPQNFALQPAHDVLRARWEAPAVRGASAVSGYTLRWKTTAATEFASADTRTLAANVLRADISGLTDGTAYTVEVAATSATGTGSYAAAQATPAPSADATLAAIFLPSENDAIELAENVFTYAYTVARATQRIIISPVTNYAQAAMQVDGAPVQNFANAAAMLADGANELEIVVTAEDESTTQKYVVQVTRLGALSLDFDGGGGVTADEAVYTARFLAGLRGADLREGLSVTTPAGQPSAETTLALSLAQLDIDGDGVTTLRDGILLARWLLDVRGPSLTAGVTDSGNADTVEANARKVSP